MNKVIVCFFAIESSILALQVGLGTVRRRSVLLKVDSSSVHWMSQGDRVRVIEPVLNSDGINLLGEEGIVISAWEKCEEDPHCCCAELAEEATAVTVRLDNVTNGQLFYFAEDELQRIPSRKIGTLTMDSTIAIAVAPGIANAIVDNSDELRLLPSSSGPLQDDVLYAYALVLPLISYKISATARGQRLLPMLDLSIAIAVIAAVVYCTFLRRS
uniref:Uncharacterized protein n=1 Tax=Aureoumbra lagunensis TaxID=44058 RepID=A0A7S3JUX6_9STRA